MFGFRPSRASPPAKVSSVPEPHTNSTQSLDLSRSSINAPVPELVGLSNEDVGLLDAIIERAGPNATAFLSVFKAYNDVLKERGMNPKEVFYYGKLLKLGTLKGGSWEEKWKMIKQQNGYEGATRAGIGRTRGLSVNQPALRPPPSSTMAPSSLTDDLFSSISHVQEDSDLAASQTSFDTETEGTAQPLLSSPFNPRSSELSNNTLGLELHDNPLLSAPTSRYQSRPAPQQAFGNRARPWEFDPSILSESSTPPSYQSAPYKSRTPKSTQYETGSSLLTDVSYKPVQTRERRGSVINEDDAWNKVKMLQNEKIADRFREERLLERSWDIWKQMYSWIITMDRQIGEARDNLVLRVHLQRWRQRASAQREWLERVAVVDNTRRLKAAFSTWKQHLQERVQEKQRSAWRQDMRMRLATFKKRRKEVLVKAFWRHWLREYQLRRSEQHYYAQLAIRCYVHWKERLHNLYQLEAHADEAYRGAILSRYWDYWRRSSEMNGPERALARVVQLRMKREAFQVWKKQWDDTRLANRLYHVNLAKRVMKSWKAAKDRTAFLERRADKHIMRQDSILLRAVMRVWKARERGKLLEKVKAFRLIRNGWAIWKTHLKTQYEAQAAAIRFSQRMNNATNKMALQRWREVYATHQNAQTYAMQFYQTQLVQRSVLRWRLELFKRLKLAKKARLAERYLLLRRYWTVMKQRYRERIALARLRELERNKAKAFFEVWYHRARKRRQIREAEQIIADRVRKRVLHNSLHRWTIRVVDIKDRELRVAQEAHHRQKMALLTWAFNHWRNIYTRHNEELRLMQSYQDIKREEMFRRIFYQWLSATRTRRHRRLALQEKEEERRLATLSVAWEKWRERYMEARLQPLEHRLVVSNALRLQYQAFATWQARTKSLPAIKFHATHLKARYWNLWLNQLPRALQVRKAKEIDRKTVLKNFLDKWIQVHRTKLSLKAVARARYFPVSASKPAARPLVHTRPFTAPAIPAPKTAFPQRAIRHVESSEEDAESEVGPPEPLIRQPRPLSARTGLGLFPSRARTDPSPTRTLLSTPRTRDVSPARSSKSTLPVSEAPWYSREGRKSKFPPAPSSVAGTEGKSSLWQELREVQRRSQSPSAYSRGRPP
ncbi:hypothetical protein PM082_012894 [Marasmius tenuissimus]|nr:hypothetical protein PM082_012894 [Marasmius tenuissimus]